MLMLLLTSIASFITSHFTEGLGLLKDKSDKAHELAIMQLQLQNQAEIESDKLAEIQAQGEADSRVEAIKTYVSGNAVVDFINGLVRPWWAYGIFFLYVGVKVWNMHYLSGLNVPHFELADAIWTETDSAILGVVLGFYFGGRSITKAKE